MKYSKMPGRYSELRMGLYRGYYERRNIVNYKDALLSITLCSDSYNAYTEMLISILVSDLACSLFNDDWVSTTSLSLRNIQGYSAVVAIID